MVRNNGHNNFNTYSRKVDVIKYLRDKNKKRNIYVKFRRVRITVFAVEKQISECVSVALLTQNAMRMRHNVICALSIYTIIFYIIS